jgi:hypothetical protein
LHRTVATVVLCVYATRRATPTSAQISGVLRLAAVLENVKNYSWLVLLGLAGATTGYALSNNMVTTHRMLHVRGIVTRSYTPMSSLASAPWSEKNDLGG